MSGVTSKVLVDVVVEIEQAIGDLEALCEFVANQREAMKPVNPRTAKRLGRHVVEMAKQIKRLEDVVRGLERLRPDVF